MGRAQAPHPPAVALATIPFAVIFRITRASVLDVLDEDYVRTAEAKGLTSGSSAAATSCATPCCPSSPRSACRSAACSPARCSPRRSSPSAASATPWPPPFREKDYPVLQVLILAAAVIYVLVNLLVDIAYAVIDPRVRTR